MTLDPKKLEAAIGASRKCSFENTGHNRAIECALEAYGVPDLEARAARADDLEQEIATLKADLDEQCRLLGAGGERELRLMAENERLKAELARFELRPIEEAPHEVLLLVGWHDKTFDEWTCEVAMASWGKRSDSGHSNRSWHGQATYFMPLPTPPQAKEADHV